MLSHLICPISSIKVDGHVGRLAVFMTALLMIAFQFTLQPVLLVVVTIDCAIRAVGHNQYSPLCFMSNMIIKAIGLAPQMVDKAPKMFASRLGLMCAVVGLTFILFNQVVASRAVIAFFTLLALADSVLNFCVGCVIYHYLVFPFFRSAEGS
jgi:hypothetical protein